MTKKCKTAILAFLSFAIALMVVLTVCINFKSEDAKADVFSTTEGVVITKEQSLSAEFLNGQKGYMFSTERNNSSISFNDGFAGDFSITFSPCSSVVGENDFESLTFKFRSNENKIGFDLKFKPHNNGVVMCISLTNIPLTQREIYFEGSFSNVSDKAISFSFKPEQMCVYNADGEIIADFQSEEYMKAYKMQTLLDSYSKYSVEIVFGGIKTEHKASIIIFDICGQKFDAANLSNTAGPIIYNKIQLNSGVKGKLYPIKDIFNTFDVKDGFKSFDGEIVVTDSSNNLIDVTNNTFTPSSGGIHYITFTPIDADGYRGESYSQQIFVYDEQPEIIFDFDLLTENQKVGVGSSIFFGAVTARSAIQEENLIVEAKILKENDILHSEKDCMNGFTYEFNQIGDYLVVFSAVDSIGYEQENVVKITVDNSVVFVDTLKAVYTKDYSLDLKSIYAKKGDDTYEVDTVVIYPDGRTNNSNVVYLDMVGTYCVNLITDVDGEKLTKDVYFKVTNDGESLWEKQDGLTITSNYDAPNYADKSYNGTLLTVTRPLEIEYKNIIDISDNSSDDLLIDLFVSPIVAGSIETSCIDIILTDIYDSNNVIDIRLTRDAWLWDTMTDMMSVIAQPKKDFDNEYLRDVCTASNNYQQYYYYGQNICSSFFGKIDNNTKSSVSQSVKLYFDYETGELYANFAQKGSELGKIVVADLSNDGYVGSGKTWKKFTTGEAYLSIKISQLSQKANVMVLNVDGQSMSGVKTYDNIAPSIFVDYAGNSEEFIPYGILNNSYKIFNAYSRDIVDGINENLIIKVFKLNNDKLVEIEHDGKTFIPTSVGDYIIRYIASDNSDNTSIHDVKLVVKNISELPKMNYEFSEKLEGHVYVGEKYKFYEGIATGGNGKLATAVKITLDNEEVFLDENDSFFVEKSGVYKIAVVISDYTRKSEEFIYNINAQYSSNPIIEKKTMPKAIILGEKFTFPEFSATTYSSSGNNESEIEYWVDGQKLENNYFVPEHEGNLNIQIKSRGSILNYNIAVISSNVGQQYVSRYFYTNATTKVIERSVTFAFYEPSFVNVLKPINTQFAYFTVSSESATGNIGGSEVSCKPGENLSRIDFTFTDKLYPDISFTASLIKKDSLESYLEYNGRRYIVVDAVFESFAKNFRVEYDNDSKMLLIGDKEICKIDYCDNGDLFNGFKSDEVYLDFAMPKVDNNGIAAIGIVNIAGQNFDISKTSNRSKPTIKILGDFYTVEINEEFTIPAAVAFDFMQDISSLSVSVVSPTGKVLLDSADAYNVKTLTADEYGAYKIVYEAINGSNFSTKNNFTVNVLDRIPPTITLSGELPEVVLQNSTVDLPTASVSDNNFSDEEITKFIYVIAPNAQSYLITEMSFVPELKGTYTIIYYAADKDNAIATLIHYLHVG